MSKPTDLVQGTVDLLILKVVALEPIHGWAVAQRIQHVSGDVLKVNQSALYPALLAANERYFGKFGFMFAKMERCNAIVVQVEPEVFLVVTTDPPTGLDIIPEIEKVVGGRR